ncbi:hypothetical protein HZB00_00245 [Candidatus Woesearchaeota archaeon]|nr:hypothetical protein [Candidatus Woesearchaeota archaeon]
MNAIEIKIQARQREAKRKKIFEKGMLIAQMLGRRCTYIEGDREDGVPTIITEYRFKEGQINVLKKGDSLEYGHLFIGYNNLVYVEFRP